MPTLKELRKKSFLTQEELAQKAKLSRYTVTRVECGNQKPGTTVIRALAKALKVRQKDIEFPTKLQTTKSTDIDRQVSDKIMVPSSAANEANTIVENFTKNIGYIRNICGLSRLNCLIN